MGLKNTKSLVAEASFAVRLLAHFHSDGQHAAAISDLWNTVLKVMDSAWVEHQRLMGADVSSAEQRLRDMGWLPWRDLYDDSSDGETDEPPTRAAIIEPAGEEPATRFDYVTDSRGRHCLAVPLDDPSYSPGWR